ncbi:kinase-like domain-containing protein [Favolaschia claudopus]|uniref:Kinase-like domain-containing protein n=1 Tax=Favolaschia claudopus TaxID=2862362 RepID=A0AAW0DJQ5_9AGAR
MSTTSWLQRKVRLRTLLKTTTDGEEECGRALDRILHGQNVIGKTAKTAEIDALRFQDADLQLVGALERGQFGLIDVVKCHLDGKMYVRKAVERRFAMRVREQCSPQFERDILLRARLSNSICAPHLLCAFQTPTHLNLVMTYGEGGSLWDVLESSPLGGRVTEEDMAWWTPQVVNAVNWCHEQGFVHRDIKPHNFVLTPSAHVLLIDFGSAAPLVGPERRVPKRHCLVPCGTCDYIAPEILHAHEQALVALEMELAAEEEGVSRVAENSRQDEDGYGFEVDWWSTGAMLYEMVYGVAPFFATDIRQTYQRIVQHERSLRFDSAVHVSAVFQDLLRRFLTHADRRIGRGGVHEIHHHPAFVEVNWTTLGIEVAPPALHLPQFTYAEPSIVSQVEQDSSVSQPFAFSALFQSSPMSVASPAVASQATPQRASVSSSAAPDDAFIGFSWGPPDDAFSEASFSSERSMSSLLREADIDDQATPRPPRLGKVLATPNPRLLSVPNPSTITPAPTRLHSYPFVTPMRPGMGTHPPQTIARSTVRRTTGTGTGTARRPVSDREAMKQLADCVGMSARKRVLASGRKPRVLPAMTATTFAPPLNQTRRASTSRRSLPPPVLIPTYGESSQGRARPARALTGPSSSERDTETESEGPPSPSPSPRPGSAMSRRSATPTLTGTYNHTPRSAHSAAMLSGAAAHSGSGNSLSVPVLRSRSGSGSGSIGRSGRSVEVTEVVAADSPTWEDTTFDALEVKHAAMMEEIMLLEERLDQFSSAFVEGRRRHSSR